MGDLGLFMLLKQQRHTTKNAGAVDHAVEATKMICSRLNPILSRRRILCKVRMQQQTVAANPLRIQSASSKGIKIPKAKTETMTIVESSLCDSPADPTTCTADQKSAHG